MLNGVYRLSAYLTENTSHGERSYCLFSSFNQNRNIETPPKYQNPPRIRPDQRGHTDVMKLIVV